MTPEQLSIWQALYAAIKSPPELGRMEAIRQGAEDLEEALKQQEATPEGINIEFLGGRRLPGDESAEEQRRLNDLAFNPGVYTVCQQPKKPGRLAAWLKRIRVWLNA